MVRRTNDPTETTLADVVRAINEMRTDLGGRIDEVRTELGDRIDDVRTELGARIDKLSTKVDRHYIELKGITTRQEARIIKLEIKKPRPK